MTKEKKIDAMRPVKGGKKGEPFVIGIGASAGGLEALQQFFRNMPGNSGLSFVVVQHLSPDYKSLMADILGKHTEMRVIQVENGMEIEPDTVYLIPPKHNMTIENGRLLLQDVEAGKLNHPIDRFFASLAKEKKDKAIAVVLSGTGSDGTSGIKIIKENGGLVIVQQPETAKFDGMPRSVINTGLADFVLSPEEIVEEILNFSSNPMITKLHEKEVLFSDDETFARIYTNLKKSSGIDFTNYKRTTILRRLERRMVVTHCDSLSEYVDFLESNEEERNTLAKEILIGVTSFFRDGNYFEKLKQNAVYPLVKNTDKNEAIRVWSAGCSTGEEAYSLAILFSEVMEETGIARDVKIFATDVDTRAIEQAGKGVFTESILEDVSPERLSRYFTKKNEQYVVSKEIRRMIIFAPHNMLSDPPFGRLDLISCRNVMIYFQPVLQKTLIAIFHSALKQGGYLFLGKSETAGEYGNIFQPVCSAEKIYIHNGEGKLEDISPSTFHIPNVHTISPQTGSSSGRESATYELESTYIHYLEQFMPASVVLNEADNVIHFFGNYQDYLTIAPGKATFNLFAMLIGDLSLAASTALNRCRLEHVPVTYEGIAVDTRNGRKAVDLTVAPVMGKDNTDTGLVAVLFWEKKATVVKGITEKYDVDTTAARRIQDLEQELHESRDDLKATIGELETVNEELQAANEELLTANEELQSSNEELQSVNEELYTVNTEYQQKLDELTMLTNDLSNFLSSTMIGILFVDGNLNIRKFTEYVGREFQLMEHDVGRSLQIFAHSFPHEDIIKDAQEVLKSLMPIDREVVAMNGRYYTLRIAPYRTTENNIRGLVITIIDSLGTAEKTQE